MVEKDEEWVDMDLTFSDPFEIMPPQRKLKVHPKLHKIPLEEFLDNLFQGELIRNQGIMSRERSNLFCDHYGECIYNPIIVRSGKEFKYNLGDGRHRLQILHNVGASHIWVYVVDLGEKYPRYMKDMDNCTIPPGPKGKITCKECDKYQITLWSEKEDDVYYHCEECDVIEYRREYNLREQDEGL